MKRSEMVYKLAEVLFNKFHADELMPSWDHAPTIWARGTLNDAHDVLTILEETGMLPPEHYRPMDWKERGITYSQWLQEPLKIRTWEPE